MTQVDQSVGGTAASKPSQFRQSLEHGLTSLLRSFQKARIRRHTLRDLRRLDHRILQDIGIERHQIAAVAETMARRAV